MSMVNAIQNIIAENKNNSIVLRGMIASSRMTRRSTSFIIATDGGSSRGGSNFPVVSFRDAKKCAGFVPGNRVTVACHMESFVRRDGDKVLHVKELRGDLMIATQRVLAEKLQEVGMNVPQGKEMDGGLPDDINEGIVMGTVIHTYSPRNDMTILTLLASIDDTHSNRVDIVCFRRQARIASNLTLGDVAAVAVVVRTLGEDQIENPHYQSLVCKDILKLQSAPKTPENKEPKKEPDVTEEPEPIATEPEPEPQPTPISAERQVNSSPSADTTQTNAGWDYASYNGGYHTSFPEHVI